MSNTPRHLISASPFVRFVRQHLLKIAVAGAVVLGIIIWQRSAPEKASPTSVIRADLGLPNEQILLHRDQLLGQMTQQLTQPFPIQTLALTGIGGSGKTTLARHYAQRQQAALVWEINAETKTSLMESFERLAQRLAQSVEDKKILHVLQENRNAEEREAKLLSFVKERLQPLQWILLYDNVEKFSDIQTYFPIDHQVWGKGQVLVTTRDSTIQNNPSIRQTLVIDTITPDEQLALFLKITQRNQPTLTPEQRVAAQQFLKAIPPFPLDTSVAAHYLLSTRLPYEQYQARMQDPAFVTMQEKVQQETNSYTQTRQSIITSSISRLLETHPNFKDLLLLVSMVDSQSIPKDLLEACQPEAVVESFLYHMERYSLLKPDVTTVSQVSPTFSMHRSTQEISLKYLINMQKIDVTSSAMTAIANSLMQYGTMLINQENYAKIKLIITHYQAVERQSTLVNHQNKILLNGLLGCFQFYLSNDKVAENLLTSSIDQLKIHHETDRWSALFLTHLAALKNVMGKYEEAEKYLTDSVAIYHTTATDDFAGLSRTLGYLGITYRELGSYEKAIEPLQKSLEIYQTRCPENDVGRARVLGYLGRVHKELGHYQVAQEFIEQALVIYDKIPGNYLGIARCSLYLSEVYRYLNDFALAETCIQKTLSLYESNLPDNHMRGYWAKGHAGNVYYLQGKFKEAQAYIEQTLKYYEDYFAKDHLAVGWIKALSGEVYIGLQDYPKAENLLTQSLKIHEQKLGLQHLDLAEMLYSLGQVYLLTAKLDQAEQTINRALKIFQQHQHPEQYRCLESLSELYIKKAAQATDAAQMQTFKQQAIDYVQQAVAIVKDHFPADSPHLVRLQNKRDKLLEK